MQYIDSLLREDVLNFDSIQNVQAIRLIFELLRTKVGSSISYLSIAEDIEISPHTVKKYIQILEALYIIFRITPYSRNIARSLLKEPKIYFFDVGLVKGDDGAKFENLVALCLQKAVFAKVDYQAKPFTLKYLHTKQKHEVDFALVEDQQIKQMIEVKVSDASLSQSLCYFHEKYNIPAVQVVKNLKKERMESGIAIRRADPFLAELDL